jgi:hypothetical protein
VVTTKIADMIGITIGIVVLTLLFGPYVAISISLIKRTYVRLTRKLKISYDMLYKNFRKPGKHRFGQNTTKAVFIPVFGIFSIASFINLLGVHILAVSSFGILLLQNKEMVAVL